jgi:hypothetical protein
MVNDDLDERHEAARTRMFELNSAMRVLHDAAFMIENADRNARIAKAASPGLWRVGLPYDQAIQALEAAVVKAAALIEEKSLLLATAIGK